MQRFKKEKKIWSREWENCWNYGVMFWISPWKVYIAGNTKYMCWLFKNSLLTYLCSCQLMLINFIKHCYFLAQIMLKLNWQCFVFTYFYLPYFSLPPGQLGLAIQPDSTNLKNNSFLFTSSFFPVIVLFYPVEFLFLSSYRTIFPKHQHCIGSNLEVNVITPKSLYRYICVLRP